MVLTIIETVKWTKRESGLRAAGSVGVVELAESFALAVAQHDEFESVKVTFHVADNAVNLHGRRNFQGDDFAGQRERITSSNPDILESSHSRVLCLGS